MDLTIYTPHLHLRRFIASDITHFIKYCNDPIATRDQFWKPIDTLQAQKLIDQACTTPMTEAGGQIAIALRDTNIMIGHCYFQIDYEAQAEFGIILPQQYHDIGYGLETLSALLHYGFHGLNLHRICSVVACDNLNNIKNLENLCFRKEVVHKLALKHGNVWLDCYEYGLLSSEYFENHINA